MRPGEGQTELLGEPQGAAVAATRPTPEPCHLGSSRTPANILVGQWVESASPPVISKRSLTSVCMLATREVSLVTTTPLLMDYFKRDSRATKMWIHVQSGLLLSFIFTKNRTLSIPGSANFFPL